MGIFQDALNLIVVFAILVFEYIGVAVILMAGIKGVVKMCIRDSSCAGHSADWNL